MAVRLSLNNQVLEAGEALTLPLYLEVLTTPASTLSFDLVFDPALLAYTSHTPGSIIGEFGKVLEVTVLEPGRLHCVVEDETRGAVVKQASLLAEFQFNVTLEAGASATVATENETASDAAGDPLLIEGGSARISVFTVSHAADWNGGPDGDIDLTELLRAIQFYNSNGYHCAETPDATEDGYSPNAGAQECTPHSSDYNPQDWFIELSELLRLIQFYNSGGYHPCTGTEDGYCPGPA